MRTAFSKPTRDPAELDRLITSYRQVGYDGLQLKMGQYLPYLGRSEVLRDRWGDDPGTTSGLIVQTGLDPEGEALLLDVIDLAASTGGELVVLCHDRPREGLSRQDLQLIAGQVGRAGRHALDRGVHLSLHHHIGQPVMQPEDVRIFFDAVQPGTVGLTVDTGHLARSGVTDLLGFVEEFGSLIDNVHLKDVDAEAWRVVGEGVLDLVPVLDQLARQAYEGWLCIDEESSAPLEHGLTASRAWLDAHLPTARA